MPSETPPEIDAEVPRVRGPELPLCEISNPKSVGGMLDGFFQNSLSEDVQSAPTAWSTQSRFSIFDEEEVLVSNPSKSEEEELQEPPQKRAEAFLRGPADMIVSARSKLKFLKRSSFLHCLETESESQCPICLEKIMAQQLAWTLPCFHGFHLSCAEKFFGTRGAQPRCPMCRFDIRQGALQQRALLDEPQQRQLQEKPQQPLLA